MAFKFNAILEFNGAQAQAAMGRTQRSFQSLQSSMAKTQNAMRGIGMGVRSVGLAAAPMSIAMGLATKEAADFEEQLSVVQSVLLATDEEMRGLNSVTKTLGATTAFTAQQAGEGAEFLARSGMTSQQIIQALPGVLDAAAASGVGLGEAADVVANQLGAFGLEASKATEVADSLSLTTALTNTNFTQLAEGMKFAAPAARLAGLTMQETASSIGVMANAGIKGSLAGTALKNAFNKLAKPTKEALDLFGGREGMDKALFRVVDGQKKLMPMEVIFANIAKAVANSDDKLQAVGKASELLGLRGTSAFGAFSAQIQKTTTITDKNIEALRKGITATQEGVAETGELMQLKVGDAIPTLVALRLQIAGAEGTAKQMARIRLDNLNGAFTLLKSAVSGLAIEVGSLNSGPLQGLVKMATDFISVLTLGFQVAQSGGKLTANQLQALKENQFASLIDSTISFATGFIEGFREIRNTAKETFNSIVNFIKPFVDSVGMTTKDIGKLVAKILLVGAVLAPAIAALGLGLFILGPIVTSIGSVFALISGIGGMLFSIGGILLNVGGVIAGVVMGLTAPALAIIAALVAVVGGAYYFRDELVSVFSIVKDFIVGIFNKVVEAVGPSFNRMVDAIASVLKPIKVVLNGVFQVFKFIFTNTFNFVIATFKSLFTNVVSLFGGLFTAAAPVFGALFNVITSSVSAVFNMIANVAGFVGNTIMIAFNMFKNAFFALLDGDITGIIDAFANGAVAMFDNMKNLIVNIFNTLKEPVSAVFDFFMEGMGFVVKGFVEGFKFIGNMVMNLGSIIVDTLLKPLKGVFDMVADTTVGKKVMNLVGISDESQKDKNLIQGNGETAAVQTQRLVEQFAIKPEDSGLRLIHGELSKMSEASQLQKASLEQKGLVQPPSARENAAAVREITTTNNVVKKEGGGGQQNITVNVKGVLRGNDINLVATRAQVEQAERNGRFVNPAIKRKMVQNGAMLMGN
jgi:TP901 family phage tail tape measure protein